MAGVVGMQTGDEPSQALPRQLSQGESQAVRLNAEVLSAMRNLVATAKKLPLGGAVAQRLRGYKWRSEKSVKAIAPTGPAERPCTLKASRNFSRGARRIQNRLPLFALPRAAKQCIIASERYNAGNPG